MVAKPSLPGLSLFAPQPKSQNPRITEWFLLEGTFENHPVQPPCHGHRYHSLDQVAQSPVQPDLEHFQ